ncbi:MAG: hypothetical protein Q9170_005334 [Blastenia crenularia]
MEDSNPTILVIHGGYFLPPAWATFLSSLKAAGFEAECPRLPTCGDDRPPTKTIHDDVKVIHDAAIQLASAGKKIIVLAHSYGGIPASEAITRSLYASQSDNGGGVIHIIYLSAWLIPKSSSLEEVIEKYGFQSHVDVGFNEDSTAYAKNAPASFYSDVQPRSRAEELAKHNVTHNWTAVGGSVEGVPWMDLPTTYVHCEKDEAILVNLQRSMVEDAREAMGGKGSLTTETLDSGHCPFLSMPDEVVALVAKVAQEGRLNVLIDRIEG